MSYRADKSGVAAENQKKVEQNFNEEEAQKCLKWMAAMGVEEAHSAGSGHDEFHTLLGDGMVICKLIDKVIPGSIKWSDRKFQVAKIEGMRVMQERERIAQFSRLVVQYGVADTFTFPTESLHEKGALNLAQVCVCIRALGIEAQSKGLGPADYWPKKSSKNVREFTEEQLRSGQSVIGLQYGTNKGASQAGMNIGKTRAILD